MDVIKGYVAIGALVGGAYVFYNWDKLKPKATAAVEATTFVSSKDVSTSKSQAKKRKPAKPSAPQPKGAAPAPAPVAPTPSNRDDDDEAEAVQDNDKEWARQLQARKTGVNISGPAAARAAPSKKQNKTKQQSSNGASSSTASELDAASSGTAGLAKAPVAGGVSDMLDAPAPAPSVLRITGEEKAKKQQAAKEVQTQETKKQRQNRRKVEEQKAQREADERERQVMLENQRRTAREARGEPAKNGMANAAAPASNAWNSASQTDDSTSAKEPAQSTSLLDTFEPETKSASSNVSAPKPAKENVPSEEIQMQMLNEMEGVSGWNEVSKGKKAKGKTAQMSSSSSTVDLTNGMASAIQPAAPKKTQPKAQLVNNGTAPKKSAQTNGFAALEAATTYSSSAKGHPDDSDWAVV